MLRMSGVWYPFALSMKFTLSLSKGRAPPWRGFDRPVLSVAEGLSTNGIPLLYTPPQLPPSSSLTVTKTPVTELDAPPAGS